jgi:hypothetical protein
MKPITDDIVQSLLDSLEKRAASGGVPDAGSMTGRVLRFRGGEAPESALARGKAAVLDFSQARQMRRARRTVSGVFHYSAQL